MSEAEPRWAVIHVIDGKETVGFFRCWNDANASYNECIRLYGFDHRKFYLLRVVRAQPKTPKPNYEL